MLGFELEHVSFRQRTGLLLAIARLRHLSVLMCLRDRGRLQLLLAVACLGLLSSIVSLGGGWLAVLLTHMMNLVLLLILVQDDSLGLREEVVLLLEQARARSRRCLRGERVDTRVWLASAERWKHGIALLICEGKGVVLSHGDGRRLNVLWLVLGCRRRSREWLGRVCEDNVATGNKLVDVMLRFSRKVLQVLRSHLRRTRWLERREVMLRSCRHGSSRERGNSRSGAAGARSLCWNRRTRAEDLSGAMSLLLTALLSRPAFCALLLLSFVG